MSHNHKRAEPSCVSLVEGALEAADDFMNLRMLVEATRLDKNHVSACIWHLARYHAIESIQSQDELWWFLTPQGDLRTKKIALRVKEDKPRKVRRARLAKPEGNPSYD